MVEMTISAEMAHHTKQQRRTYVYIIMYINYCAWILGIRINTVYNDYYVFHNNKMDQKQLAKGGGGEFVRMWRFWNVAKGCVATDKF